jgi:hypothetical protein
VLAVSSYYVVRVVRASIRRSASPPDRLSGALLGLIFGYSLLYAPMGVWNSRQAYVVVAPFSILVARLLVRTATAAGRSRVRRGASLVPQVLLILWILAHSPSVKDLDPQLRASWSRSDRLLRDLHGTLASVPDSSSVRLAIPFFSRPVRYNVGRHAQGHPLGSRQPSNWMNTLLRDRAVSVRTTLSYELDPLRESSPLTREPEGDEREIRLESGIPAHTFDVGIRTREPEGESPRVVRFLRVPADSGRQFLYVHDGLRGRLQNDEPWTPPRRRGPLPATE